MGFEDMFDIGFWVKFILIGIAFVILPVWIMKLVSLSFKLKVMFTFAGFVGVFISLTLGSLIPHRRR